MVTRLRYVDTLPIASTSGALAYQQYRVNSTFDPDYSYAGHQPMYRDTYAAIYSSYAVISCKIKVTIVNTSSVPIHCGVLFDDNLSASSSYTVLMEQNNGKHKLVPALQGSLSSHVFTLQWDAKKMLGIDPYASEMYKTAVGSNPAEDSLLVIWSQPVDLASTITPYINTELEMLVMWSELVTPTGS